MQQLDERVILGEHPAQRVLRSEEIDLRRYWSTVYQRKWAVLGFAVFAAVAAAIICRVMDPVYRASSTVMIEAQPMNIVTIQDIYGMEDRGQEYYQTQFEILKSRPLAEKVVKRLELAQQPEYLSTPPFWKQWLPSREDSAQSPTTAIDPDVAMVNRYREILRIAPIPKTQLVTISYEAEDPALAAAVVNAHAKAFIESYMEAREAMTRSASEWMTSRVAELKEKLNESERKLQAFKEREHLVDLDQGLQSISSRELSELTTKLVEARRVLSENRNAFEQVNQMRTASLDEKLALPAIASDPLIKQFRQERAAAELQIAELAKRYGPMHPKMKAALSQRDAALSALENHIGSVMDSIKNQQSVLEGQARAIASAMDATKANVQSIGRKESEYRSLQQEVETNRQLFDLFYKRITETKETSDLDTAQARVIEPATVPIAPSAPNKTLITLLAFAAALIVGVVAVLLLEAFDNTLKDADEVEAKLGLPLLGLVPHIKLPRKYGRRIGHAYLINTDRRFGEAIRTLRTAVTLSNLDSGHKVIMVTSSVSEEGKTSIASNLAIAFAQLEKVLLIDADMRRPAIADEFEVARGHPGLSALCARTAGFADCIVRKTGENLDVLVAGDIPPNPQEMLASQKFKLMLNKLAERYDRVIIDCPPVLPVSDALLLANAANAAIYVVRADKTSALHVRRGLERLRRSRVEVIGVVLNQTDARQLEEYEDYGGGYLGKNLTSVPS